MQAKLKRVLYWVTISLLSLVIIICGILIATKLIGDEQDKKKNQELVDIMQDSPTDSTRPPVPSNPTTATEPVQTEPFEVTVPSDPEDPSEVTDPTVPPETEPPTEPAPSEPPSILLQFQALHAINEDMVGWIEIPGTEINYPVVQSPYEANFYLRKNFYKEKATCGTIYVREACDVFKPSDNVTIYGHNMRNGTMFADLHLYEEKDFWEDNKYIYFDTLYEYHTYEIFAVFISTADLDVGFSYHIFDDAANQAEYDEFVATCKELSLYDTGITPQLGEKLITLSTCDKSIDDGRFVVVARRVV